MGEASAAKLGMALDFSSAYGYGEHDFPVSFISINSPNLTEFWKVKLEH